MWAIWAKQLLPLALKSSPKFNKSPNLVTLVPINSKYIHEHEIIIPVQQLKAPDLQSCQSPPGHDQADEGAAIPDP